MNIAEMTLRGKNDIDQVYDAGDSVGYKRGYNYGYQTGESKGYNDGHHAGYELGKVDGWVDGYEEGKAEGGSAGYANGYADGVEEGKQEAIERYCPVLTESGAVVTCNPVENYPLNVVSNITPIQDGSGDTSPTNPRPITARTAVKVTVSNGTDSAEHNTELPQDAYCGNLDWSTGVLTLTHKMQDLTKITAWSKAGTTTLYNTSLLRDSKGGTSLIYGWCSHVATTEKGTLTYAYIRKPTDNYGIEIKTNEWGLPNNEVATWNNHLQEQAANDTPVQVLYELNEPITVQLTPQEILSLSSTNTVYCDTGDTTVTFKADPIALVGQLEESIISLGGEI